MSEEIEAPNPIALLGEARWLLELPSLLLRSRRLARQPRGRGQPVLVLPGFGGGDASTGVLRTYLRYLGYRPRGWGLGRNTGDVPVLLARVAGFYRRQGIDLDAIEAEVEARNQQPLATPVTAIYSRSDGVVAWRACIDRHAPRVFEVIAELLARPGV